jgi:hypothetical protein
MPAAWQRFVGLVNLNRQWRRSCRGLVILGVEFAGRPLEVSKRVDGVRLRFPDSATIPSSQAQSQFSMT